MREDLSVSQRCPAGGWLQHGEPFFPLPPFFFADGCNGVSLVKIQDQEANMVQVLAATFKDGVFKPDERPALSESARVRLVVESIDADDSAQREESWAMLQRLWNGSSFNSGGDRLNREQLHERH